MLAEDTLQDFNNSQFSIFNDQDINKNDESIVLLVSLGNSKILLTGDLEEKGEKALIANGLTTKIDVLKAGHHGAKTSSSAEFINRIQPEKVIISSGQNNTYGHPHPEVLAEFKHLGAQVYRTDKLGSIKLMSEEGHLQIK